MLTRSYNYFTKEILTFVSLHMYVEHSTVNVFCFWYGIGLESRVVFEAFWFEIGYGLCTGWVEFLEESTYNIFNYHCN